MPVILAHGALGFWDDLVFLGVIIVFLMLSFSMWFLSRNMNFEQVDLMPSDGKDERFQLD